jgi:hypothetical protein
MVVASIRARPSYVQETVSRSRIKRRDIRLELNALEAAAQKAPAQPEEKTSTDNIFLLTRRLNG